MCCDWAKELESEELGIENWVSKTVIKNYMVYTYN